MQKQECAKTMKIVRNHGPPEVEVDGADARPSRDARDLHRPICSHEDPIQNALNCPLRRAPISRRQVAQIEGAQQDESVHAGARGLCPVRGQIASVHVLEPATAFGVRGRSPKQPKCSAAGHVSMRPKMLERMHEGHSIPAHRAAPKLPQSDACRVQATAPARFHHRRDTAARCWGPGDAVHRRAAAWRLHRYSPDRRIKSRTQPRRAPS
jgi:hypothetical protein